MELDVCATESTLVGSGSRCVLKISPSTLDVTCGRRDGPNKSLESIEAGEGSVLSSIFQKVARSTRFESSGEFSIKDDS